jgi:hypothetical protein
LSVIAIGRAASARLLQEAKPMAESVGARQLKHSATSMYCQRLPRTCVRRSVAPCSLKPTSDHQTNQKAEKYPAAHE